MVKCFGDGGLGDDLGLFPQLLHLDLEPRIARRVDLIPLRPVAIYPVVPTSGGHPKPVDQHDRRCISRLLAHDAPSTRVASPRTGTLPRRRTANTGPWPVHTLLIRQPSCARRARGPKA